MSLERNSMSGGSGRLFNLRILLVIAISALVLAGILGVSVLHNVAFTNYAKDEALRRLNDSAEAIASKAERLLEPATGIARYVLDRAHAGLKANSGADRREQFDRFLEGVDIAPEGPSCSASFGGLYLGYPDGSIRQSDTEFSLSFWPLLACPPRWTRPIFA